MGTIAAAPEESNLPETVSLVVPRGRAASFVALCSYFISYFLGEEFIVLTVFRLLGPSTACHRWTTMSASASLPPALQRGTTPGHADPPPSSGLAPIV